MSLPLYIMVTLHFYLNMRAKFRHEFNLVLQFCFSCTIVLVLTVTQDKIDIYYVQRYSVYNLNVLTTFCNKMAETQTD